MKLQIWGSGAGEGMPSMFCSCKSCRQARALGGHDLRTRSCSLVDEHIMLDFGQDIFYNAYRYGKNLRDLSAVVFTHAHIDHLASAELCMRAPDYCDIPEGDRLPLYGNETCISEVQRQLRYDLGRVPDIFDFHVLRAFEPVRVCGITVTPLPACHAPSEHAFLLLLEDGRTRYLHCMDTAFPGKETTTFLSGLRLDGITMDCTYGDSRPESDSHMGIAANIRFREQLLRQGSADDQTTFILSHIAHHSNLMHRELSQLATQHGMLVAYDGFEIQI